MLWVISDNPVKSPEVKADIARLRGNKLVKGAVTREEYSHSRATVQTVLTPAIGVGEEIFVSAHAGYGNHPQRGGREPWIAGLWFDEIAADLVTKFTAAGLSGRTLWFLVCHTGANIVGLANELSARGVRSTTIYMPKEFMYISTNGIPHVLENQQDADAADREVAKYDAVHMDINGSKETGVGWAGATIDAGGAVTALKPTPVQEAVVARFDPDLEGDI